MKKGVKAYFIFACILFGLTAAVMILSGVGITCVAFGAEKYDSMQAIVPYKPLYQVFVFVTLLTGIAEVYTLVHFIRGKKWAYLTALILMAVGIISGEIHMYYSNMLRGTSAPNFLRVYVSIFTLVIWLLMRIPGLWNDISSRKSGEGDNAAAGGAAMIIAGISILSMPFMATSTHILGGVNWAHAFDTGLGIAGLAMLLTGGGLLFRAIRLENTVKDEVAVLI